MEAPGKRGLFELYYYFHPISGLIYKFIDFEIRFIFLQFHWVNCPAKLVRLNP